MASLQDYCLYIMIQISNSMGKRLKRPKILVFSTDKISDPGIDQAGLRKDTLFSGCLCYKSPLFIRN